MLGDSRHVVNVRPEDRGRQLNLQLDRFFQLEPANEPVDRASRIVEFAPLVGPDEPEAFGKDVCNMNIVRRDAAVIRYGDHIGRLRPT